MKIDQILEALALGEQESGLTPEQEAACRDTEMEAMSLEDRAHVYGHLEKHGELPVLLRVGRIECPCKDAPSPSGILTDGIIIGLDKQRFVFRKYAALRLFFSLGQALETLDKKAYQREEAALHPATARAEAEVNG